jgi:hypothetical protein
VFFVEGLIGWGICVLAEIEMTDPAKELAALAELFSGMTGVGGNTITAISNLVGIGLSDPELLEVLAALQRRVSKPKSLLWKW